eukprot:TRINITY_DN5014_c0_g1_i2.p1 TRINITY_DN5014_c0_g1~~TRINITY_DN5014_c0_g1_i2.p1  ORF type:complete len:949 (+),score=174.45 TRINITY_DN5014_c0_g1_i2:74-2920(+)
MELPTGSEQVKNVALQSAERELTAAEPEPHPASPRHSEMMPEQAVQDPFRMYRDDNSFQPVDSSPSVGGDIALERSRTPHSLGGRLNSCRPPRLKTALSGVPGGGFGRGLMAQKAFRRPLFAEEEVTFDVHIEDKASSDELGEFAKYLAAELDFAGRLCADMMRQTLADAQSRILNLAPQQSAASSLPSPAEVKVADQSVGRPLPWREVFQSDGYGPEAMGALLVDMDSKPHDGFTETTVGTEEAFALDMSTCQNHPGLQGGLQIQLLDTMDRRSLDTRGLQPCPRPPMMDEALFPEAPEPLQISHARRTASVKSFDSKSVRFERNPPETVEFKTPGHLDIRNNVSNGSDPWVPMSSLPNPGSRQSGKRLTDLLPKPERRTQQSRASSTSSSTVLTKRRLSVDDEDVTDIFDIFKKSTAPGKIPGKSPNKDADRKDPLTLARVMASTKWDLVVAFAILSNTVYMGVEIDQRSTGLPQPEAFRWIGYFYTLIFAVELLLRLLNERGGFFTPGNRNVAWNYLDMFVVATSIFEVYIELGARVSPDKAASNAASTSQLRIIRVVRITRLIKIFRIARILRFVRALRTLVNSIFYTLKSVFWALLLMVLIMYIFAMLLCQAVNDYARDDKGVPTESMSLFWGNLLRSMLTLLMTITGGISWHDCVVPLTDIVSPMPGMWVAVFLVYVVFMVFAVLNVITGFFCESAIQSAKNDHDLVIQEHLMNKKAYIKKIKKLFSDIDEDGSGEISKEELEAHLNNEMSGAFFEHLELDVNNAHDFIKLIDADGTGDLDLAEFVEGIYRLRGPARALDIAEVAFDQRSFQDYMCKQVARLQETILSVAGQEVQIQSEAEVNEESAAPSNEEGTLEVDPVVNEEDVDCKVVDESVPPWQREQSDATSADRQQEQSGTTSANRPRYMTGSPKATGKLSRFVDGEPPATKSGVFKKLASWSQG